MDDETFRVLWHTPTEYNPLRHGPPYLPGGPYTSVKLSSQQREGVRSFAKTALTVPAELTAPLQKTSFATLLGFLQGAALVHQTHHWSTSGRTFYSDHKLYEQLYNESLEFIDQVAERMVGLGAPAVTAGAQVRVMLTFVQHCGLARTPEEMTQVSLSAELLVLNLTRRVIANLDSTGTLTPGTSNLLEGLADKHETFVYLLQQRSTPVSAVYSYDRT